jgi:hypothetical protein
MVAGLAADSVRVVATVAVNVAVTDLSVLIATVQEPAPEQSPLQPTKTDPESAVGVRVTFEAGVVMV